MSPTSLHEAKKIRTEVVIPACKYNCSEGSLMYRSQPLSKTIIETPFLQHNNSRKEIPEEMKKQSPLFPYFPFFNSPFFHDNPFRHPLFNEYPLTQKNISYPYGHSSFNVCPNEGIGERPTSIPSETKIK